jgi:hypothetical protein
MSPKPWLKDYPRQKQGRKRDLSGPEPVCGNSAPWPKLQIVDDSASQLRDFILFCARRRSSQWPAIYDEMTRVAGQRLFRGLSSKELKELGLSFSLSSVDKTIQLVKQVTSQENL